MTNRYDYAVISDLHINSDACVTKSLISFLENIYDDKIKIDRLIINGDILDSYSLNKLSADQLKIFDLLHWLNYKERVLWIEGNHDRPAEKLQALCGFKLLKSLVVSSGRKIIYLEHGDRADDFIQKHPKLTKGADFIYWLLQKIDGSHRLARMAKHGSKDFVKCVSKVANYGLALGERDGYDAVICGHTHYASVVSNNKTSYFNSGCWTEKPCTLLTIDEGKIDLRMYRRKKGGISDPIQNVSQLEGE